MGDTYDFDTILNEAIEDGKKLSTLVRMSEKQRLVLTNKNDRTLFLNKIIEMCTNLKLEIPRFYQYLFELEDSEYEKLRVYFLAGLTSSVHYKDITDEDIADEKA